MSEKVYEFRGHEWEELAECWGLIPENEVLVVAAEIEALEEKFREFLRGQEVIYAEGSAPKFANPQIRADINRFLLKLAEEEEKTGYNAPIFRAMAEIESDTNLARWLLNNLERMWT